MMLLAVSCAKDEGFLPVEDELSDQGALKKACSFEDSYILEGSTHFPSYAVKEHKVISPDWNMLSCDATLLSLGGQDYSLETIEWMLVDDDNDETRPMVCLDIRKVTFPVKIAPSGSLKFYWPETWEEVGPTGTLVTNSMDLMTTMFLHTGCEMYGGPGINQGTLMYKGSFDGENFSASAHFMGKQKVFGLVPFYAPYDEILKVGLEDVVEGPIRFTFSIELHPPTLEP